MKNQGYSTLSMATNGLRERGYRHSFTLEDDQLVCLETGKHYRPGELRIVEQYRFEGDSNPADMSIVFALECNDGTKGTVISAYGIYATNGVLEFMEKVTIPDQALTR